MNKRQTIKAMTEEIQTWAIEKNISLVGNIPEDVNAFDELFRDGGEARCEHFCDLTWDYALKFGELESIGFDNAQWRCVEGAMEVLKKRWNKPSGKQVTNFLVSAMTNGG